MWDDWLNERTNKAAGKRAQRPRLLLLVASLFNSPVWSKTTESLCQCWNRSVTQVPITRRWRRGRFPFQSQIGDHRGETINSRNLEENISIDSTRLVMGFLSCVSEIVCLTFDEKREKETLSKVNLLFLEEEKQKKKKPFQMTNIHKWIHIQLIE